MGELKLNNSIEEPLSPGQQIDTSWGFIRLDKFNEDGDAVATIKYGEHEIPAIISHLSEIDIYVTGGFVTVATVISLEGGQLQVAPLNEPVFNARDYMDVGNLHMERVVHANPAELTEMIAELIES